MNLSSNLKKDPEALMKLLDDLSDPTLWNGLSNLEKDLVKDKLRTLYELIVSGEFQKQEKGKNNTVEWEVPESADMSPAFVDEHIHQSESEQHEIETDELISAEKEVATEQPADKEATDQPDLFTSPEKKMEAGVSGMPETKPNEKEPESIADKIHKEVKIDRLKTAIGINEKFFFINELFDGNLNAYNEAIDVLDGADTLEKAQSLVNELSEKHRWSDHEEAKDQLWQFIERKLS